MLLQPRGISEIYFFSGTSVLWKFSLRWVSSGDTLGGSSTFQTLSMRCCPRLFVDALLQEEETVPFQEAWDACCGCQRTGLTGRDDGLFSPINNADLLFRHRVNT
ncbi:unnamed protein product, partial [Ectocarpus sp. 12 AP-2014]